MPERDSSPCPHPLKLTRREAQMLLRAAGARLEHLLTVRATSSITGSEMERRINEWNVLIAKIGECID